tara:strand:- start:1274 stop:1738 length:465 start_codon:yes stop_codon:yes gene_type:complete
MTKATQSSRTTRASTTRKKTWAPPGKLDVGQDTPEGMHYRWVRHELLNNPDDANVNSRIRQGYEPVKPEELGVTAPDVLDKGKYEGTVRSGDLILMKVPQEIVDQRDAYYQDQSKRMAAAYNQDLKNASTDQMPVSDESKTTYSSGPRTTKFED